MDTIQYTGKVARTSGYAGVCLSLDCELRCPVCKETTHFVTYGTELSLDAVKSPQKHLQWLANLACDQHNCPGCGVVSKASRAGNEALVASLLERYTSEFLRGMITKSGAKIGTGTGRYSAPDDGTYQYETWKGGEGTVDRPVDVQLVPLSEAS